MSEEPKSLKKPRKQTKKEYTSEQARAEILKKLEKAGAKGVPSPVTAKTAMHKRAVLERALAEMEGAQEIFVDRRKAKERFYRWADRPPIPTRESVAAALEAFAEREFPRLLTPGDLKGALGKDKEAQAFLFRAFELLAAERRLIVLRYEPAKKKQIELYAHQESLRKVLAPAIPLEDSDAGPETGKAAAEVLQPDAVRTAYQTLATRTGFPAVPISALQRESAAPLDQLKEWLRGEHQEGRAVLSSGDWSLADEDKRSAAVEIDGERYLLVRLIP